MGIADLVPGVSGGTIALITNIYEDLIISINQLNAKEIFALFGANRKSSWQKINGPFLIPLFLGIACLLYTSPSPRDRQKSRMPSSA